MIGSWPFRPSQTERSGRPAAQMILAVVIMSLGMLLPIPALRALIVLPLALFVPGYAVLLALFGPRAQRDPVPVATAAMILSLVVYILLALALAVVSISISEASVVGSVDLTVLTLTALTMWRPRQIIWSGASTDVNDRRQAPSHGQSRSTYGGLPTRPHLKDIVDLRDVQAWHNVQGLYRLAGIALVTVLLLAIAGVALPKAADPPFSQFYFTGASAQVSTILQAAPSGRLTVNVGVTNSAHQRLTYQIVATLDEHTTWARGSVTLPAGASWSGTLSGAIPRAGCVHLISLSLHEGTSTDQEGSLSLWARGAGASSSTCANP